LLLFPLDDPKRNVMSHPPRPSCGFFSHEWSSSQTNKALLNPNVRQSASESLCCFSFTWKSLCSFLIWKSPESVKHVVESLTVWKRIYDSSESRGGSCVSSSVYSVVNSQSLVNGESIMSPFLSESHCLWSHGCCAAKILTSCGMCSGCESLWVSCDSKLNLSFSLLQSLLEQTRDYHSQNQKLTPPKQEERFRFSSRLLHSVLFNCLVLHARDSFYIK
jgi:hypothetical protein